MTIPPSTPTAALVRAENIDSEVTTEKLREFFEFCGEIIEIHISEADEPSGTKEALVLFGSSTAAKTAIMLTDALLRGKTIKVSYYFEEFADEAPSSPSRSPTEGNRDREASKLLSEWIARGMLLTDKLVETGRQALAKYRIIERVEPIVTQVTNAAWAQGKFDRSCGNP
jgi:RNA recognition motif-containing protein